MALLGPRPCFRGWCFSSSSLNGGTDSVPGVINEASLPGSLSLSQPKLGWLPRQGIRPGRFVSLVIYNSQGNGQEDNIE